MRIIQVLPTYAEGDAIGNDVAAIDDILIEKGFDTDIYAQVTRGTPRKPAKTLTELAESRQDVIIYHLSKGSGLNRKILEYPGKKVMVYHNITPPRYFAGYNEDAERVARVGINETRALAGKFDMVLCDSEFNKQDLLKLGYAPEDVNVLPIVVPFTDYDAQPDAEVIKKYGDGRTNILFVGRIAPNKKFQDLIHSFYYYKRFIDTGARLILAGSYGDGREAYFERLQKYVASLELDDVIFTGHIPFSHILAYYKTAEVFLCLSEHEGFCVPLIEAMYFGVPIIAYDAAAVKGTLSGCGVLLETKEPEFVAGVIDRVVKDKKLRDEITKGYPGVLEALKKERISTLLEQYLRRIL